jgi:hypothetical protein
LSACSNLSAAVACISAAPSGSYYLLYEGVRPRMYMTNEPGAQPESVIKSQPYAVAIRDARAEVQAPSLDRNGFVLRSHTSAVLDFTDDAQVTGRYYAECEACGACPRTPSLGW